MPIESWSGKRYMLTIIDDHSRKVFVYFPQYKSEVKTVFQQFIAIVETECNTKVKIVRSDNGTEYCNQELTDYFKEKGIKHQLTIPYTPQQNGLAERTQKTIMNKVRCMLQDSGCERRMWAEAANTAAYIINRSPTKKLLMATPEEKWLERKVDLEHIRVFGCKAYAHIPREKRTKLDPKSKQYIFVGYCEDSKAYRLFDPLTHNIVKSRDVVFYEEQKFQIGEENQTADQSQQIILYSDEGSDIESNEENSMHDQDENEDTLSEDAE